MKLAVWDVDGTLVDSRAVIHEACCEAFAGLGLGEPTYDEVRQVVGLGLAEALSHLSPALGGDDLARLVDLYKGAFQKRHAAPGYVEPLYEGARESLLRLKSEGWRLAMATGKSRRGVDSVMRMHGWEEVFDSTHCDDDGPGKPHPAMLRAAMAACGVRTDRTVMIGDTAHDMRMARAAGVRAQGVAWGFHTPDEVLAAGADHLARSFAELDEALDAFGALRLEPAHD